MLLITHIWRGTLIITFVLYGFPQGANPQELCWKVDPNQDFYNFEDCKTTTPGQLICGLDKATGLGVGCVKTESSCPPKEIANVYDLLCSSDKKLCCCFVSGCTTINKKSSEKLCSTSELTNLTVCKPQIFCRQSGDDILEQCGHNPVESPYCTLDPKTGLSTGCSKGYPKNKGCNLIPGANDLPFGIELVCNDELCCCKGFPGEYKVCNTLTAKSCQLKELANLEECRILNMGNSTTGSSMGNIGNGEDSISKRWTVKCFLLVGAMAMVYLHC